MASVYQGLIPIAPVVIPVCVVLVARLCGASWPMAIVIGSVALVVVWFFTHQQSWTSQPQTAP